MMRYGRIADINYTNGVAKVALDEVDIITDWATLPKALRSNRIFKIGQQVAVLYDGEDYEILNEVPGGENNQSPSWASNHAEGYEFSDGTKIVYDTITKRFTVTPIESGKVVVAGDAIVSGNQTVMGDLTAGATGIEFTKNFISSINPTIPPTDLNLMSALVVTNLLNLKADKTAVPTSVAELSDAAQYLTTSSASATYATTSHYHVIGDITGLSSSLSALVPNSRTVSGLPLSSDISQSALRTALGLGPGAYDSTDYLPLIGGTLTGQLNGTDINLSGGLEVRKEAVFSGQLSIPTAAPLSPAEGKTYLYYNTTGNYAETSGSVTDDDLTAYFKKENIIVQANVNDTSAYSDSKVLSALAVNGLLSLKANVNDIPTTIAGFSDANNYLLKTEAAATYALLSHTHEFSALTNKPTTIAGYGITDAIDISSPQNVTGKKTFNILKVVGSLAIPVVAPVNPVDGEVYGYYNPTGNYAETSGSVTDDDLSAYLLKTEASSTYSLLGHTHDLSAYLLKTEAAATYALLSHTHEIVQVAGLEAALSGKAAISHTHDFSVLTNKPTTIAGYGITDAITTANISSQSVASAAKLTTVRTLWGQSFDGTANISGSLTDVASIVASSEITASVFQSRDYYYMADGSGIFRTAIDRNGNVPYFGYGFAVAGYDAKYGGYNTHLCYGSNYAVGLTLSNTGIVSIANSLSVSNRIDSKSFNLNYYLNHDSGLSFYADGVNSWQIYMADAGVSNCGAYGLITARAGNYVTGHAMRFLVDTGAGEGFIWETMANGGTSPNLLLELRNDGLLYNHGRIIADGGINTSNLHASGALTVAGAATLQSSLQVSGSVELRNVLTVAGLLTAQAGLNVTGNSAVSGNHSVTGDFEAGGVIIPQAAPSTPQSNKIYLYYNPAGNYAETPA